MEISSRTPISGGVFVVIVVVVVLPGSVHSGSVSLEDRGRMVPDELRVGSFP